MATREPAGESVPRAPEIVVGVDGSELSAQALRWALRHAQRMGAHVEVVTAWEVSPFVFVTPTATDADDRRKAVRAQEHVLAEVLGDTSQARVTTRVVEGRAGVALCRAAVDADMLVLGVHGRKEFPRAHLGSVAGYCVHHAPCPVLVVRSSDSGR